MTSLHYLVNFPKKTLDPTSFYIIKQSCFSFQVSVSAMPGHTRHIQTLNLDEDVVLLDCPGLVLPAYAVAPDLLLTAVLPIDQVPRIFYSIYIYLYLHSFLSDL